MYFDKVDSAGVSDRDRRTYVQYIIALSAWLGQGGSAGQGVALKGVFSGGGTVGTGEVPGTTIARSLS